MNKQIFFFCLTGFLFVSLLGALSHFFYEWSGNNKIVGFFFAANESTWEHLKLAFFPTLLFFFTGAFFLKSPGCLVACFAALIVPVILIPVLFYSYTSVAGTSFLAADIAIYLVSVAAAFALSYPILCAASMPKYASILAATGIAVLIVCFATFTLFPPHIFLFRDPLSGKFGL